MQYLSVCSGIEAATVAWSPLGFEALAFAEVDKFPSAVLAHYYPQVPNLGDMALASQWSNYDPDILVGGTPCQSFSVAGLRKGLADPRGNLMLTYLAIADRYQPEWIVWENVPGVLSSGSGRDFGTFLGALGQIGYGWAYRVLDAQFFGVPQRRRRVFVVGHFGDWRRAAAVLFERHSLQGHPPPSREARQDATPATGTRTFACGGIGSYSSSSSSPLLKSGADLGHGCEALIRCADVAHATTHQAKGGDPTTDNYIVRSLRDTPAVAGCLNSAGGHAVPGNSIQDADQGYLQVVHSLRGEGFDASEDGAGRDTPLVPISIRTAQTPSNGCGINEDGTSYTLDGAQGQAIAFDCKASGQNGFGVGEIASTMRAMGHAWSHRNGGGHQAVAFQSSQSGIRCDEIHATLDSNNRSRRHNGAMQGMQIRRLTPRECERLQGFPDDYTLIPFTHGKPAADGPRYKALGNSMAVPVMRWIGERIQLVDWLHGNS